MCAGKPSRVGEVGEFPLIERLVARLAAPRSDAALGPGDDVAAIRLGPRRLLLVTCDAQVAGTHFVLDRCDARRLGHKAVAINVSDIAAAGGVPTHFVVSLIVPDETEVAFLEALYDGLAAEASRWGADVLGGNVSRGEHLVIDLTLLGEARPTELLRRDGARVGDRVLVTGRLGAAAAGLRLTLDPGLTVDPAVRRRALDAFETPEPRLRESRALVAAGGVSAAIDLSDGLAADLGHVCDRSGVGVRVHLDALPLAAEAHAVAAAAGVDAVEWALGGGEDYELAFTAAPRRVEPLSAAVESATGTPVSVVGEIVPADHGRQLVVGPRETRPLLARGWRHF